jgi:hypothetical protein
VEGAGDETAGTQVDAHPHPAGSDVDAPATTGAARWRPLVIGVLVVGWLGVQLVVPALRLIERGGGARPRTFGWQMFSHQLEGPAETFTVTTAQGERRVSVEPLLTGPMRREILYAPLIVRELCADEEVLAVTVADAEWGTSTVACR